MNQELYARWLVDAKAALTATQYTEEQAEAILDFFRRIKGSAERELVGEERVDAYLVFGHPEHIEDFQVYNSMMSRLWTYVPYILRSERLTPETKFDLEEKRKRDQEREEWRVLASNHRR